MIPAGTGLGAYKRLTVDVQADDDDDDDDYLMDGSASASPDDIAPISDAVID